MRLIRVYLPFNKNVDIFIKWRYIHAMDGEQTN